MPRIGKIHRDKGGQQLPGAGRRKQRGVDVTGYGFVWGRRNVLGLGVATATQLCEHPRDRWAVLFKRVNFMV